MRGKIMREKHMSFAHSFTQQRALRVFFKRASHYVVLGLSGLFLTLMASFSVHAFDSDVMAEKAKGQTVYFNAWGGSPAINSYISWAGDRLKALYGIELVHIKLTDTAEAVSRILAEKAASKTQGGSVDLIWVNGENFATMSRQGLLRDDAWAFSLPSFALTDPKQLPAVINDFALPTLGRESPWGRAQLVFAYDTAFLDTPPRSAEALREWIKNNPGRFSYPLPPDFTGTSFLKQILLETASDRSVFAKAPDADANTHLEPLFKWLDEVTPYLWRDGKNYPANYTEMVRLLGDGEITIAFAFNPAEFSNAISQNIVSDTVRTYIHDAGTLANVHFVAIPFNASAPEAAQLTADFLLSFEAQLRKADAKIWGDPTVLSMDKLDARQRAEFDNLPRGIASLTEAELATTLAEPHPDWMGLIEAEWQKRYSR